MFSLFGNFSQQFLSLHFSFSSHFLSLFTMKDCTSKSSHWFLKSSILSASTWGTANLISWDAEQPKLNLTPSGSRDPLLMWLKLNLVSGMACKSKFPVFKSVWQCYTHWAKFLSLLSMLLSSNWYLLLPVFSHKQHTSFPHDQPHQNWGGGGGCFK